MGMRIAPVNMWLENVAAWWTRGWASQSDQASPSPPRSETVFLLLGGAARGAAQAGALTVLFERGIKPDRIIGISSGAWNGSFIAQDPTPEQARALEDIWRSVTTAQMLGPQWRMAVNLVQIRKPLYSGEGVRRLAKRYLADQSFSDLRVPLQIVAADLALGEPVLFTEGPLDRAVLASSAIPVIFPPVTDDGRVLVDGGIVEWAGCLAALESGASTLVVVGCGGLVKATSKWQTLMHIYERAQDVSTRYEFDCTVSALRGTGREVLSIYPAIEAGAMLDFNRAESHIRAGRLAAERALAEWEASKLMSKQQRADPVRPIPRLLRSA